MVMLTGVWGSAFGATIGSIVSDIVNAQNADVPAEINCLLQELGQRNLRPLAGSLPNCMKGIPGDIEAIPADIEAITADIEAALSSWRKLMCCCCRKSQRTENQTDATKGKNVKRSKIRCSFRVFFYKDAETESDNADVSLLSALVAENQDKPAAAQDYDVPVCIRKEDKLTVVDAGTQFNLPFPPLLRPERHTDIFLVFDYSWRESQDANPFTVKHESLKNNEIN